MPSGAPAADLGNPAVPPTVSGGPIEPAGLTPDAEVETAEAATADEVLVDEDAAFHWPPVTERHDLDGNGNPAGGWSDSTGFHIVWQNGPVGQEHGEKAPNGAFVESVIQAVIGRLNFFQSAADGKFACAENIHATIDLEDALDHLRSRARDRIRRGVYGINEP
jgi:hypothetical protein